MTDVPSKEACDLAARWLECDVVNETDNIVTETHEQVVTVIDYLRSLHEERKPILLPPIEDDTTPGTFNRIGINMATGHPRVYRDGDHHIGYTYAELRAGDVLEVEHGTGHRVRKHEVTDD